MKTFRYLPAETALLPADMDPEWTAIAWDDIRVNPSSSLQGFVQFFVVPGVAVHRVQSAVELVEGEVAEPDLFTHLERSPLTEGSYLWFETKASKKHGSPLHYAMHAEAQRLSSSQCEVFLKTPPFLVDFTHGDLHLRMQDTPTPRGKKVRTLGDAVAYGYGTGHNGTMELRREILSRILTTRQDPARKESPEVLGAIMNQVDSQLSQQHD